MIVYCLQHDVRFSFLLSRPHSWCSVLPPPPLGMPAERPAVPSLGSLHPLKTPTPPVPPVHGAQGTFSTKSSCFCPFRLIGTQQESPSAYSFCNLVLYFPNVWYFVLLKPLHSLHCLHLNTLLLKNKGSLLIDATLVCALIVFCFDSFPLGRTPPPRTSRARFVFIEQAWPLQGIALSECRPSSKRVMASLSST